MVEPEHEPRAAVGHEPHVAGLARLEPHRRSCRNVEAIPACRVSIECECSVGLGEMKVTANLNGSVAGVCDGEHHRRSVSVQHDLAGRWENLTRCHVHASVARIAPPAATAPIARKTALAIESSAARHSTMPAP